MNFGVVTVTYGNRIEYLSKLISGLDSEVVKLICVIVNGSPKRLFKNLSRTKKVKLIFNNENLGSAKGYKQGIEFLKSSPDIDFIWLMDDDNLPKPNAIENLIKFHKSCNFNNEKDALLSYRPDRPNFLEAVRMNNGSIMLKGKNSALGFSLIGNNDHFSNYRKKGLKIAPYGGFFFNKNLIDRIGYPDEKYFLYGDDYDFTIRVSKNGGKILLVEDSVIDDLETSFHIKNDKRNTILKTRYHNTNNLDRIFYSVRNGIKFELKHMVDNKLFYYLNLSIYSLLIGVLLVFNPKKIRTFYKGVFNGIKNRN